VKRLELKHVRVCQKCGRGRAELESADGARLSVPLDPVRARELSPNRTGDDRDEVRWLGEFVLSQLVSAGATPTEVVLDQGEGGLRALLSFRHRDEHDVLACTAQEGIGLAVRGKLALYATDEAFARDTPPESGDRGPHLH
jgi:hypothetical protein